MVSCVTHHSHFIQHAGKCGSADTTTRKAHFGTLEMDRSIIAKRTRPIWVCLPDGSVCRRVRRGGLPEARPGASDGALWNYEADAA